MRMKRSRDARASAASSAAPPPLRVAIVGAGAIGSDKAVEHFGTSTGTVIVYCVDKSHSAAIALKKACGGNVKTSCELDQTVLDAVDIVYIATPPHSHKELALRALNAGRHVLLEKPLAACGADADAIVAAAENATACVLGVNIGMRWNRAVHELRKRLASSRPAEGRLSLNFAKWPREWQQSEWVAHRDQGGPLREVGTHFLFALQELFGRHCVKRVKARVVYDHDDDALAETAAEGTLELTDGLAIQMSLRTDGSGLAAANGTDAHELRFSFPAEADGRAKQLVLEDFTRLRQDQDINGPSRTIVADGGYGETECIEGLVERIRGGGKADGVISAAEARDAQSVLDALLASGDEWVDVQYKTKR